MKLYLIFLNGFAPNVCFLMVSVYEYLYHRCDASFKIYDEYLYLLVQFIILNLKIYLIKTYSITVTKWVKVILKLVNMCVPMY